MLGVKQESKCITRLKCENVKVDLCCNWRRRLALRKKIFKKHDIWLCVCVGGGLSAESVVRIKYSCVCVCGYNNNNMGTEHRIPRKRLHHYFSVFFFSFYLLIQDPRALVLQFVFFAGRQVYFQLLQRTRNSLFPNQRHREV